MGVTPTDPVAFPTDGPTLVPAGTVQARLLELAGTIDGGGKNSKELPKKQRVSTNAKSAAAADGSPRAGTMSLISLNCRGCGEATTVREIRCIADSYNPSMLFLSETKMSRQRSEDLKWRLGFQNAIGVNSLGLSGGLVLLWKNGVTVNLKSYSKFHIDVWVSEEDGKVWRFTGFYGESMRTRRKESWCML